MRYATHTAVPVERSRGEIERTLTRYGASRFMYGWEGARAVVMFEAHTRRIRFVLDLPARAEFEKTPGGRRTRRPEAALQAWEQACRQRWRALCLVIKAKLEAVASGIAEFETEFLPYTVLPNGQTVAEWAIPQLGEVYARGTLPRMLPGMGETGKERR